MDKKLIKKVSLGTLVLGLLISIYNFFNMYSITGKCPTDSNECSAYDSWMAFSRIGALLVIIGLTSYLSIVVIEYKNKKK